MSSVPDSQASSTAAELIAAANVGRRLAIPFPTIMGSTFMLLGFMLYVVSMQSYSGLLLLVLGIVFGVYIVNMVEVVRSCRSLQFQAPASIHTSEGKALQGTWEIRNTSDHLAGHACVTSSFGELLKVGVVAPHSSVHVTPNLSLPRRGVYPYHRLRLQSTFPFGLMQAATNIQLDGEIVVYPAVYPCPPPPAAGFEPMVGGKFKGRHRAAAGDQFRGVRPHQPSDPMKRIHWPSSSKGLGIMVKEFDEELSGRVGLILDVSAGRSNDRVSQLDWAARATGSLMLAALDVGHQVEFTRLGDEQALSVPPFADGDVVLEALARLEPRRQAQNPDSLDQAVNLVPRKGSVCLVMTHYSEALDDLIQQRLLPGRRKVGLYLPMSCRGQVPEFPFPVCFFNDREIREGPAA